VTRAPDVLAPVRADHEVAALVAAGATRLYCGVSPRAWTQRYSRAVWLSRRGPEAAVPDLAALGRLVAEAARYGLSVDLALNAPSYTDEQLEQVLDLARGAIATLGVAALIVADPSLMLALGEAGLPFAASTVFVAHNPGALALARELGAVRAVLPRHLDVEEIAALVREAPGLDLEVIAMFDGCAFEEGHCHTVHGVPGTRAFCQTPWSRELVPMRGPPDDAEKERWAEAERDYAVWLEWSDACATPLDGGGAPNGTCGLCALPALAAAGVAGLKVAGRQAPLGRRLRGVQMVRAIRDVASAKGTQAATEHARGLRLGSAGCASGAMCAFATGCGKRDA